MESLEYRFYFEGHHVPIVEWTKGETTCGNCGITISEYDRTKIECDPFKNQIRDAIRRVERNAG